MFLMDIQLCKLVITHFLESLRTLAANIISYLGHVVLPPQYKVYLDPLIGISALTIAISTREAVWS